MALAEFTTQVSISDTRDGIDDTIGLLVEVLRTMPLDEAVTRANRYQNMFVSLEAELFARNRSAGASDRDNETLAGRGTKTTKLDAKRRAKRGAAVSENPTLADELAGGALGTCQIDAIADASMKTQGDAARDDELISSIKNASPDEAGDIARAWVDEYNHPDGDAADQRRQRQRRRREARKFSTTDGCSAIIIKGDDDSVNDMWANLSAASKRLWLKDGGRDVPAAKHPRTRAQRLFDAAHYSLVNTAEAGSLGIAKTTSTTTLFLWQKLDDFTAGRVNAHYATGDAVPHAVLSRHMCAGTVAGVVFDKAGEVLWTGREQRFATPGIFRGLVARDKGCVLCGANPSECEAHHLIPWNAPGRGQTNVDEMALVCSDCHHYIHNTSQTLYRDIRRRWKLRPATPDETPPSQHHREHRRRHG